MYYVYVLRSKRDQQFYTGSTNNLRKRFKEHNDNKVFSTKGRGPLELIYYEACLNEQDARMREKYLKSGMGKRYIKNRLKRFLSPTGFTLLELLVVLIIIGFLVTAVGRTFRKVDKDVQITAALTDMKAISDAIVKRIYPDVGRIPCTGEDPILTTACLCLGCSEKDQETIQAADPINLDELSHGCRELVSLLTGEKENIEKTKFIKKTWNKYYSKGWRGPYIEASAMIDATYFDPDSYPPDGDGNHVDLPAIATPWADKCEKMAKGAEKKGDDDLAKQYRKGKYYQILKPVKKSNKWEIPKDTAFIVCRGPDCLPGDNRNNDDMQDYLSRELSCQEDCVGCDKECKKGCIEHCQRIHPGLSSSHREMKECINACCEKNCGKLYDECVNECVFEHEKELSKNLTITNPDSDDYMDIGDDMIMFVFSGGVRSPLER